jgi:hypothetical protein
VNPEGSISQENKLTVHFVGTDIELNKTGTTDHHEDNILCDINYIVKRAGTL